MLTHLKNKIQALEIFDFKAELVSIVTENKDKIADLQRDQLAEGKDANDNFIQLKDNIAYGFGYRPLTVSIKQSIGRGTGAITSHVTWFMTGQLHSSIRAFIQGEKFSLKSPDSNFSTMIARSGPDAVGLNMDSRRDFVLNVTRPKINAAYNLKVRNV